MDGTSEEPLARARLAGDEYRCGVLREEFREVAGSLDRYRPAENPFDACAFDHEFSQPFELLLCRPLIPETSQSHVELGKPERLREVVRSAFPHGGDRCLDGSVGGHHNDIDLRAALLGLA
jgi:hypothetical protein